MIADNHVLESRLHSLWVGSGKCHSYLAKEVTRRFKALGKECEDKGKYFAAARGRSKEASSIWTLKLDLPHTSLRFLEHEEPHNATRVKQCLT